MTRDLSHSSRSALKYLALAALFSASSAAHADAFCDALTRLTTLVSNEEAPSHPLPGAQSCRKTLTLDGSSAYHCAWDFPYRAPMATETFERFNRQIGACFEDGRETVVDPGVNHPDSYRQHEHHIGGDTISVSIKEKGALQETYVFVTIKSSRRE